MHRFDTLLRFLAALREALLQCAPPEPGARELAQTVAGALQAAAQDASDPPPPLRLPVCIEHLERALGDASRAPEPVAALAQAFGELAPTLAWWRRGAHADDAPAFRNGHANTTIVGPGGLTRCGRIVVGASLLAPQVAYPLHRHPAREIYLVLSDGQWYTPERGWRTPAPGGTVYHTPDMVHAMRAGRAPLLAIWCLAPEGPDGGA